MEEEVVAFVGDLRTGYKDSCNPETEAGSGPGQVVDLVNGLWMDQMPECLEKDTAVLDTVDLDLPYEPA